jgi:hypothetical protein
MSDHEEAFRINNYLANFGANLTLQPLFRLVWSTDQLEKRWGDFSDYVGPIFLRTVHEVREVPKYWYIPDRWVLERWFPPEIAYSEEVPDSRFGSYEPLYVFDKEGTILPLRLRVIEIIMKSISEYKSPTDRRIEKENKKISDEKLEQEYFDRVIDGSDSGLGLQLHWKEAIIVPSNFEKEMIK